MPDIWYQVRKKVGDIRDTLPQGIVGPGFNDEFGDTYGIVYGFTADGFTDRELRDYVDEVRKQLLQLPDIAKIDILGAQDERIYVEFSTEQLAGLGIDRSALIAALQAQNAVTPAGVVQTGDEKILVRVSGAFRSEQDVLAVNFVAKNGRIIRLGDIAHVTRGPADPAQPMFRVNGKQGIGLAIAMRKGGDVLALGRNVAQAMAEITANLPVGIEPTLVADQPVTVAHAVDDFMEALWEAVAIVLGVSLVSLGLRAGAVVALSIPLVLAAVFVAMSFARHRPSADLARRPHHRARPAGRRRDDHRRNDGHASGTRRRQGEGRDLRLHLDRLPDADRHARHGGGLRADRVRPQRRRRIHLLDLRRRRDRPARVMGRRRAVRPVARRVGPEESPRRRMRSEPGPIMRRFRRFLLLAMRRALGHAAGDASACSARPSPACAWCRSSSSRPRTGRSCWWTCSCRRTRRSTRRGTCLARVDQLLAGDPDVDHWSTYVGQGAVRFYLPLNVQLPNDFFGQLVVVTKGLAQRERVQAKLEQALATGFPSVVARVYPLELGPPVGWPLQYRVSGVDPGQVRAIAFKVAQILDEGSGARNVNYNWMEPARTVRIRVDQDQARLLGLSSEALAQALNTVVSGITSTQMRSGTWLVDVLVRATADQRMSLSTIRALQVPLPNGQTVPLSQIASVGYGQEYPIVWRRDRRPTVTVQADAAPGVQAATVVQALAPRIEALNASLPDGYHVALGGTVEESSKAEASVTAVLPLMLILILTVLMIQLQSFNRLFLVLSVAPLGLIGVVAALLLADKPLGFVALLGVLALTGMIARNSVILIDQIEKEKAHGRAPWDAVVEATAHRFRPILLTAAAAILGMIPIAPTIFWGPMAFAIMGGLAVATVLTLVFLPALYVTWFRIRRPPPAACRDADTAQATLVMH